MQKRPPVITIMGHVDHGKTTLLDAIRKTNVAKKEFGGITQHVSAYQVTYKDNLLTFIDTPGHEAFTQMRARGGKVADIIILVVATNEGVKPQTIEAILHAKASQVPIIVALTKTDLPGVSLEKIKKDLAEKELLLEGYGGDTVAVPLSAKENKGITDLLETIVLTWEMEKVEDLSQNDFEGVVIESLLDKRRGPLASVIVKKGTLSVGDTIFSFDTECKVKALIGFNGKPVKEAGPATPVEILGFKSVPQVGSILSHQKTNSESVEISQKKELDKNIKILNLVLKADTQGTLEALQYSIAKLTNTESQVNLLYAGVGSITQGDILLASSAGGIVMGFNVDYLSDVEFFAKSRKTIVRTYHIIYELIEELTGALQGMLELEEEKIKGRAEIVAIFNLPSGDIIYGAFVFAGRFKVGDKIAIWDSEDHLKEFLRDPKKSELRPLFETKVKKLKLEKNFVDNAPAGKNYGFLFDPQFKEASVNQIIHKH
ncbi:MAG: translation initiation factor IF-2 [Patescibacteria group bacterium]|nr:translation initiation factor IF-2 [Patescibacteria group bacterium]